MTFTLTPSAAMLVPRPRRVMLSGQRLRAAELRVADAGRLEGRALRMFPHPTASVAKLCAELAAIRARGESVMKPDTFHRLVLPINRAAERWPPRYGSEEFGRYIGSEDGARAFLWLVLRRVNPGLDRATSDDLAGAMTAKEWARVSRIGWGHPDMGEAVEVPEKGRKASTPVDWGAGFDRLETERGWTRSYIASMPISQFFASLSGGGKRRVTIEDRA